MTTENNSNGNKSTFIVVKRRDIGTAGAGMGEGMGSRILSQLPLLVALDLSFLVVFMLVFAYLYLS